MIIAVDIGNTNIEIGFVKDRKVFKSYKLSSNSEKSRDDWLLDIYNILTLEKIEIKDVVIASVVPVIEKKLSEAFKKFFKKDPLIVGKDLKVPIVNRYKNPDEVGIDRLINAYAALNKISPPLIVVDLGTAITFDIVNKDGEYEGGAIFPGIESSVYALFSKTAKLPMVEIDEVKSILGKTTSESIKAGIYFGYCSLIEGMIKKFNKNLKTNFNVVLTGGNSKLISNCIEVKYLVDEYLMMEGIYLIYEYNLLYPK
jgi:type III pantothenate kinase